MKYNFFNHSSSEKGDTASVSGGAGGSGGLVPPRSLPGGTCT